MLFVAIIVGFIFASAVAALPHKRRMAVELTSAVVGVVALLGALRIAYQVSQTGLYSPSGLIAIDALGAVVMLVVGVVGCASVMYSIPYFRKESTKKVIGITRLRQYHALTNLFMAAMFLAVAASYPVISWIFLEVTTLSTIFLISFYNRRSTIEAAWKYMILNTIGLLLGFFGTLLYFASVSGDSGPTTWHMLVTHAAQLNPAVAQIAFIFVLIGYGTKIGLAPMHTWKPDAYSKAPAPIGALLSSALMPVAFVILLRFKEVTDAAAGSDFSQHLLIAFGLLSLLVAALSIPTVGNYKRLLAYSSVEHAGIMALGFGFGGAGAVAAMLHLIFHSLVKPSLFFSTGNLLLKYHSARIERVGGVMRVMPVTGVLIFAGLFAVTGFPPFGIFITEFLTLSAGVTHYLPIVVIALLAMALAFVGFFRHASAMILSKTPTGDRLAVGEQSIWLLIPPVVLLIMLVVMAFFVPDFLQILIEEAV